RAYGAGAPRPSSVLVTLGRPLLPQLPDRATTGEAVGAADLGPPVAAPVALLLRGDRRGRPGGARGVGPAGGGGGGARPGGAGPASTGSSAPPAPAHPPPSMCGRSS